MGRNRNRFGRAPSPFAAWWFALVSAVMLPGSSRAAYTYDRVIEFISPDTGNSVVVTAFGAATLGPAGSAMLFLGKDDGAASGMVTLTASMATLMTFMSTMQTVTVTPFGMSSAGKLPGPTTVAKATGMVPFWPPKFFARNELRASLSKSSFMFGFLKQAQLHYISEAVPLKLMGSFVKTGTMGTIMTGTKGSVFIAPSATGPLSPLLQVAPTTMAPTLTFVTSSGATYTITAFDARTAMGLGTISAVVPVQLGLSDGTTSFYFIRDTFTLPEAAGFLALAASCSLLILLSRSRRQRAAA